MIRFFKRYLDVVPKIRSAFRPRAPRLSSPAHVAKKHVEDVAESALAETKIAAGRRAVADKPETVVLLALMRIGEHFVGFVDLLEAVLGLRLIVRDVGMMLACEGAICPLDRIPRCVPSNAEDFVVILRGH